MLRSEAIATKLRGKEDDIDDPFVIVPEPDIDIIQKSGSASIDLRLGCWFKSFHKSSLPVLLIEEAEEYKIPSHEVYVPFEGQYILHPRDFVLAVTLEWIKMPAHLAGYIHGKSSWGRRGLIVATAAVIHPGFTGCITLELTNLGEIPIAIKPGMRISQLCLHYAQVDGMMHVDQTSFKGQRKPNIGKVKLDYTAKALMQPQLFKDESIIK